MQANMYQGVLHKPSEMVVFSIHQCDCNDEDALSEFCASFVYCKPFDTMAIVVWCINSVY